MIYWQIRDDMIYWQVRDDMIYLGMKYIQG